MIWLPKYQDIEVVSRVGLGGEYRMVVTEADGTVASDTGWFKNVITDLAMDRFASTFHRNILSLGTGTATPATTDTSLQAYAQSNDTVAPGTGPIPSSGSNGTSPYETSYLFGYRFNIGSLNGTYTEVGVSSTANGTSLSSRALISPGITVTSTQQLDAFYKITKYPPLIDTSNTVTIAGTSYTVAGRSRFVGSAGSHWKADHAPSYIGSSSLLGGPSTLGAVTSGIAGATSSYFSGGAGAAPYVPGSYQRTATVTVGTDNANFAGGVTAAEVSWSELSGPAACSFQYVFGAGIPKDSTKLASFTFGVSWARYP